MAIGGILSFFFFFPAAFLASASAASCSCLCQCGPMRLCALVLCYRYPSLSQMGRSLRRFPCRMQSRRMVRRPFFLRVWVTPLQWPKDDQAGPQLTVNHLSCGFVMICQLSDWRGKHDLIQERVFTSLRCHRCHHTFQCFPDLLRKGGHSGDSGPWSQCFQRPAPVCTLHLSFSFSS